MKGFLTTKQAAERLGVSDSRVRQMILEGVIKNGQKFGRENVISEAEVKRLESLDRKPGRPAKKNGKG
jgi:excisionase family DNA binding protein